MVQHITASPLTGHSYLVGTGKAGDRTIATQKVMGRGLWRQDTYSTTVCHAYVRCLKKHEEKVLNQSLVLCW